MLGGSGQITVLDPANKIEYVDQQPVEVLLGGDPEKLVTGRVIGRATSNGLIDYWIILLDERINDYPFQAIAVQHTFIRPQGDNRPFLCEGVSRAHG